MRNPSADVYDIKRQLSKIELAFDKFMDESISIPNSKSNNLADIKEYARDLIHIVSYLQETE